MEVEAALAAGDPHAALDRGRRGRIPHTPGLPARRGWVTGGREAPRARRDPSPCAERARGRVPVCGRRDRRRRAGPAGRAARAIPRERISALSTGRRTSPPAIVRRRSGPTNDAAGSSPRNSGRNPSTPNRVCLPPAARTTIRRGAGGTGERAARHGHPQPTNPQRLRGCPRRPAPLAGASRQPRRSSHVLPWPGRRGWQPGAEARRRWPAANSVDFVGASGSQRDRRRPGADVGSRSVPDRLDDERASDTVSQIDPRSRTTRSSSAGAGSPAGIAVGDGGARVANHGDDTVSWINPRDAAPVRADRLQSSARGPPPSPTATARSGSRTATTVP